MRLVPLYSAALASLLALAAVPSARGADEDHPVVVLDTTLGPITVELDRAKAPITVDNFLKYVDKGFYDGTVFHRVIGPPSAFMVQTGGFTENNGVLFEKRKEALPPIKNESGNGLSNVRGTLAMARTSDPNSATSQFFINLVDNLRLDNAGGGYTVFGKVTSGMDVVDNISKVETGVKPDSSGRPLENVPTAPITIKSAKRKSVP
jgi:peptidyl-prolyl cis-trans isomerase A (cyclophilin A)